VNRCQHNRPPILCEQCADLEVAKHKQLWHAKAKSEGLMDNKTVFRINGTILEKAGGWVAADIAELEAEVVKAVQTEAEAVAHSKAVQMVLTEARKAIEQAAQPEQPAPPAF
jgi:hypothetical protein